VIPGASQETRKDRVRSFYDEAAQRYQKVFTDGAMSRVRKVERAAIHLYLEPGKGEEILDAGCGTGFHALPLTEKGCLVTGIDLSPRMVATARDRGIDAHVADLESFDLSRTFDKILCGGSLEFCSDQEAIFANFARHLKPNGRLVVLYLRQGPGGWLFYLYHLFLTPLRGSGPGIRGRKARWAFRGGELDDPAVAAEAADIIDLRQRRPA